MGIDDWLWGFDNRIENTPRQGEPTDWRTSKIVTKTDLVIRLRLPHAHREPTDWRAPKSVTKIVGLGDLITRLRLPCAHCEPADWRAPKTVTKINLLT